MVSSPEPPDEGNNERGQRISQRSCSHRLARELRGIRKRHRHPKQRHQHDFEDNVEGEERTRGHVRYSTVRGSLRQRPKKRGPLARAPFVALVERRGYLRGYLRSNKKGGPAGKRRAPFRHSPKRRAVKHDASQREGGISSGRVRAPMGYRSSRGNSRHRTCLRAGRGSRPHDRARSTSRGPCRSRRSQEQSPQLPEPRSGPRKLFPAPREGQRRRGCRQRPVLPSTSGGSSKSN